MNDVKIIQKALETHVIERGTGVTPSKCHGCTWMGWNGGQHAAEAISEALWEHQTITTVEQLATIKQPLDDVLSGPIIKCQSMFQLGEVYEMNTDGTWALMKTAGGESEAWSESSVELEERDLPAILLWGERS